MWSMLRSKVILSVLAALSFTVTQQSVTANYDLTAAQRGDYIRETTGKATLIYPLTVELVWETENARFQEIPVKRGDQVREGDVLAIFSIEESDVEFQELQLKLQRTKEQFEKGRQERMTDIAEAEASLKEEYIAHRIEIVKLEIEKKQIALEKYVYQTEKEIAGLEEQLAEMRETLENNQLTAPFDGIIESVTSYRAGDKVTAGETLITMYSTENYLIKAEESQNKLRYNMEVIIETGHKSNLRTFTGTVVVSPGILSAEITDCDTIIRLDEEVSPDVFSQNIQYSGNIEELHNILLADKKAIRTEDNTDYVYVWENGTMLKRFVKKGLYNTEFVWILDGLSEGQMLIQD